MKASELLHNGIDPNIITSREFDYRQSSVIFDGLMSGLDVDKFCTKLKDGTYFSGNQMREILFAMKNGFNLHKYKRLQKGGKYMSGEDMEELNRKNLLHKDLSEYFSKE